MNEFQLSKATQSLWGKLSDPEGERKWLPLFMHLCDTSEIAGFLWDEWLPKGTKQIIASGIDLQLNSCVDEMNYAKQVAVFLAGSHDIGKASPAFQCKAKDNKYSEIVAQVEAQGLSIYSGQKMESFQHALLSQRILEKRGLDRSFAVVLGGHHGRPPDEKKDLERADRFSKSSGIGNKDWDIVHDELIAHSLQLADLECIPKGKLSVEAQVILTGFLIMADWIASGEGFPLFSVDFLYRMPQPDSDRSLDAWDELQLPRLWKVLNEWKNGSLYEKRFQINTARPVQDSLASVIMNSDHPGIVVLEAPMGEGKTEAALVAAEIMANKHQKSGVYFALPTQATSDGIFKRINKWVEQIVNVDGDSKSIFLAHGKAGFNEDYAGIKMRSNAFDYDLWEREDVIVNEWTSGRKKGLLSDFVVGTVDQILMCGLKQKHLALRHLGIANKVVIIDECHAYDAYMSSYLFLVLKWLGAYQVPVIILSATLPSSKRKHLVEAYMQNESLGNEETWTKCEDYPLITWSDRGVVKQINPENSGREQYVEIRQLDCENLACTLKNLLIEGGCVGIIRNTVKAAQETARRLDEYFQGEVEIYLLHARFISEDRVNREKEVRNKLGPPNEVSEENRPRKMIVVGTQVMEQSLDVDFDVLFTDICPMDLLLQRIGRLHRHNRIQSRPNNFINAVCYVMGVNSCTDFEDGSLIVYGKYLLMKTYALLPNHLELPGDISRLVQMTYEEKYEEIIIDALKIKSSSEEDFKAEYELAKDKNRLLVDDKESKAKSYQIYTPEGQRFEEDLIGWLSADLAQDPSGKRGEATVRDIDASLEVLVVQKRKNGKLYTLPWIKKYGDCEIEMSGIINDEMARSIAGCTVSLPREFTNFFAIENVISELEQIAKKNNILKLYTSPWLAGELFLIVDEDFRMNLAGCVLEYNKKYGLCVEKTEG